MTKKRFRTKRRRVKKQSRRKSKKMRKNMRGGHPNRSFVQKIARCIPQDPVNYSDIPFSPTGYMNDDDNWNKLAQNIRENGPIEFVCDGKNAEIYGEGIVIDYDNNIKKGYLYGTIGDSQPVLLWSSGIQQTYQAPQGNVSYGSPLRTTRAIPPPLNMDNINGATNNFSPPGSPLIGRSLFEPDDDDRRQ